MPCSLSPHLHRRQRKSASLLFPLIALAAGLLTLAFAAAPPAGAQTFDATTLRQATDMGMTWLVKAGDDPAWAQKDFDDSQWLRVDPNQSLKTYFRRVHPNILWYRLHVKVEPNQTGLAFAEYNLTSAFEIYVNGQRLMKMGQISPFTPTSFGARILVPIPDAAVKDGSLVIALRLYISSNEWVSSFPGLYPYNLTFGQKAALADHIWLTVIGDQALVWISQIAALGLGLIALALFAAQRQQREYFWLALLGLTVALFAPLDFYRLFHNLPAWSAYIDALHNSLTLVFGTLMYLAFLRVPARKWIRGLLALAAAGLFLGAFETAHGAGSPLTVLATVTPQLSLIAGIIPMLLILDWRRGNREAGILLIPAIVESLTIYLNLGVFVVSLVPGLARAALNFQTTVSTLRAGPFSFSLNNLSGGILFELSLAIIIVLRSTRIAEQQAHMKTELAAAREVQQILVPEQIESVAGLAIENAYQPAQEVGGDFFQILPALEGSLLIVIGDVAGKGLPAAMLVSVLVGAIRGVAEYTSDPTELLANLNQRLMGRVGTNFATALAARISPNGAVELANAGHLAPYLDGKEVEVPGALPLGAKIGTCYETVRFLLPPGSRLTFYSDGIVEAQNERGELFGFERSRGLAMQPVAKIIETAKLFGQHDDMTAISITRAVAAETAAEPVSTAAMPELGVVTP